MANTGLTEAQETRSEAGSDTAEEESSIGEAYSSISQVKEETSEKIESASHEDSEGDETAVHPPAEFSVRFPAGLKGFALASWEELGVFVARLLPGGMAEVAGIAVADRVLRINEKEVELTTSWQECVRFLQEQQGPVIIKFSRTRFSDEAVQRIKAATARQKSKPKSHSARKCSVVTVGTEASEGTEESEEEEKGKEKEKEPEEDAGKCAVRLFEEMRTGASSREALRAVLALLEIYSTEKGFVRDIELLVYQFKLKLCKQRRQLRCAARRDVHFCEHHMPKKLCVHMSSVEVRDRIAC